VVRDLLARAGELGFSAEPVFAGEGAGGRIAALFGLDAGFGFDPKRVRGVVAMNLEEDEAFAHVRADAPPFLLLSAHAEPPRAARTTRTLARALERAGVKHVRSYHVAWRDAQRLASLSGDRNDVADLVAAFVRDEPTPGGPDGAFVVTDRWGADAPLSSEGFRAGADERLVNRKPIDDALRRHLQRVMIDSRDLDPWPLATYDAVDLAAWLRAHPELGTGNFVVLTNVRGEAVVLRRDEIDREKPEIVVGIDDERNLFRMFVTYNVYRTYSWKPEPGPRPLLVRHVGAFLHIRSEPERVATWADFALTPAGVRVVAADPLAAARGAPVLVNEQGCLQCHALHGVGARAHHLRAGDGTLAEAFALPFEEYPRDVLRRFLFEQEDVAKSFGVGPIRVSAGAAGDLLARASSP
jgi:hypothetical protein